VKMLPIDARQFARLHSLEVLAYPQVDVAGSKSMLHVDTWYFPQCVDASYVVGALSELFDVRDQTHMDLQEKYEYTIDNALTEPGATGLIMPTNCAATTVDPPLPVRLYDVRVTESSILLCHDSRAASLRCAVARYPVEHVVKDFGDGTIPQNRRSPPHMLKQLLPGLARRMGVHDQVELRELLRMAQCELSRCVSIQTYTFESLDDDETAPASSLGLSIWACLVFGHILGATVRVAMDASQGACAAVWKVDGDGTNGSFVLLDPVRANWIPRRHLSRAVAGVDALAIGTLVHVKRRTYWRAGLIVRLRPDMNCVVVEYLGMQQSRRLICVRALHVVADARTHLATAVRAMARS
jgi:hypothetical protein